MEQNETKANTIYYTTKYEILEEVVRKTDEIKDSNLLKSAFIAQLGIYITNKSGMVLVSFNEKKEMNGCVVISRHIDKEGEYIWIDFRWSESHNREIMKKFYEEIIGTCKVRGIKRIQGRTNRDLSEGSFKALNKLYGAYEIGRIFELNIGDVNKT